MYEKEKTMEYYDKIAKDYDETNEKNTGMDYSGNHYRRKIAEEIISKLQVGTVLDAGCGTGHLLAYLKSLGFACAGCDFSDGMLIEAKKTLGDVPLVKTSLDDLSAFKDQEFDYVFCMGVLPYIPEEQEAKCYSEINRVLADGGTLVTAHENELFDIFTFNKYTLRFFRQNIYPMLDQEVSEEKLEKKLASLIKYPKKPINKNLKKSGRDYIFTKPENPLTYPEKLKKYGFDSIKNRFYHFHALPPLICNESEFLLDISREMELKYADSWQAMFIASMFVNVAVKNDK